MANEKETKKKIKRPTALKRDMQNETRRARARAYKSRVRTALNALEAAMKTGGEEVKATFKTVQSLMDKGVKKGVYNRNQAARVKSRLNRKATKA